MKIFRTSNKNQDIILMVELSLLDICKMLLGREMSPTVINTKIDRITIRHGLFYSAFNLAATPHG